MSKAVVLAMVIGGLLMAPATARLVGRSVADNPLQGVWRVMDAQGQAGPGVYIFTARHYSMMTASPDRPDITDTSQATADELRALWNPMIANSGVYEIDGSLVTIHPIVAKIPVVMKPGAYEVYAFAIQDKTLSLTQRRNVRGPVEGRPPTMLLRAE
jgi:hypothetical protein